YYPGWRAFVDGREQPLVRGDLLFRVIPVPGGDHDVELRFEPASVRIGLAISVAAAIVAIGTLVMAGRASGRGRTT
ncbi:MAG: YfhO family protein, partial [Chloroflexota bacterium]|nr:YfhO family protein [Chloroflexota bacterium]